MRRIAVIAVLVLVPACGNDLPVPDQPSAVASSPSSVTAAPRTSAPPSSVPPSSAPPTDSPGELVEVAGGVVDPADAARDIGVDPATAVAALSFEDSNGINTVVLSETKLSAVARRVDAVHVVGGPRTATTRVLRRVTEAVEGCEQDITAQFVAGSLAVWDVDEDLLGEVVFAYVVACRGGVGAASQKLLLLENGTKHILRGQTRVDSEPQPSPDAEPAPSQWPAGAYDRAVQAFRDLPAEFVPQ